MENTYRKIAVKNLSDNCSLASPRKRAGKYRLSSPAISLMVDFSKTQPITASASLSVNDALELMRTNRVRALMVTDSDGNFTGLITAMDLMGRKPMAFANKAGIPRTDVQVKDVMLAKTKLKGMARADVDKATIGGVLQVLRSLNEQHILVVENEDETMQICGLFSASDFRRALDIAVDTDPVANTFMDLERVINKNQEVM